MLDLRVHLYTWLQLAGSHVGTENPTQVLCKNSKWSWLLRHVSSPWKIVSPSLMHHDTAQLRPAVSATYFNFNVTCSKYGHKKSWEGKKFPGVVHTYDLSNRSWWILRPRLSQNKTKKLFKKSWWILKTNVSVLWPSLKTFQILKAIMHLFFFIKTLNKIFLYSDISIFRYLNSSACPHFFQCRSNPRTWGCIFDFTSDYYKNC